MLLQLCLRPSPAFAAENLFLHKQLALYEERQVKPRRATHAIRLAMMWLSHGFYWRSALRIVKPETFTCWHRQGFRVFWRWKSTPGRPALPKDLRALIRRMALENPIWGQERIANELLLTLGLRVSPRTVRKYMPSRCVGNPVSLSKLSVALPALFVVRHGSSHTNHKRLPRGFHNLCGHTGKGIDVDETRDLCQQSM